jgi:hypothetical protein
MLVTLVKCDHLRTTDITLKDAASWFIHPVGSDDVLIDGVSIIGDLRVPNNDGIRPDPCQPGFSHIIMKPAMLSRLSLVDAEHESLYGLVKSSWEVTERRFTWKIELPPKTRATVSVPGAHAREVHGAPSDGTSDGHTVFQVRSAKYRFESALENGASLSPR